MDLNDILGASQTEQQYAQKTIDNIIGISGSARQTGSLGSSAIDHNAKRMAALRAAHSESQAGRGDFDWGTDRILNS